MNKNFELDNQQKQLIFDYSSGLTTTEEETVKAERLISTNEQAAKLHSALKFFTKALGSLGSEPCPDELVERTILRLKSLANGKQQVYLEVRIMKIRICPKINADLCFLLEDSAQEVIPVYSFVSAAKGVYAQGCMLKGGFLVFAESLAAKTINRKLTMAHKKLRGKLIEDDVLKDNGDCLKFTRPFLFKNEYEATSVIVGNNKFRIYDGIWTDRQGRTPLENQLIGISELEIKDIQKESLT